MRRSRLRSRIGRNLVLVLASVLCATALGGVAPAAAEQQQFGDPLGDVAFYDWASDSFYNDPNYPYVDLTLTAADHTSTDLDLYAIVDQYDPFLVDSWIWDISLDGSTVAYTAFLSEAQDSAALFDANSNIIGSCEVFHVRSSGGVAVSVPRTCLGNPQQVYYTATAYNGVDSDPDCCRDYWIDTTHNAFGQFYGPIQSAVVTSEPSPSPTTEPSPSPTTEPSPSPTTEPSPSPTTTEPTSEPSPEPTEPTSAPGPAEDQPGTKRLAGPDRYSTAAEIVQDSFPGGPLPVVFIATGEAFADALAGGPAADVLGGPILPVAKAGIPAPIRNQLNRLDPARIVVLGGPGAVSDAIVNELQSYTSGSVSRMAGANRYATAAKVALDTFDSPVPQAIIATGTGFADALAGGPVGAKTNSPVLLVDPVRLPAETAQALRALQPKNIAVLGGPNAVSDAVLNHLKEYTTGGVTRLAGANRYATAAKVVEWYWPGTSPVVYLATGRNFPDALAGAPAAGLDGAPLLLVEPTCMPPETKRQMDRLQPSTTVILGGQATVSDAAAAGTVCGASQPAPSPSPTTEPSQPANPGDTKNCSDFSTQGEAQAWFDYYYPYYGDVANLDADGDLVACESLP